MAVLLIILLKVTKNNENFKELYKRFQYEANEMNVDEEHT